MCENLNGKRYIMNDSLNQAKKHKSVSVSESPDQLLKQDLHEHETANVSRSNVDTSTPSLTLPIRLKGITISQTIIDASDYPLVAGRRLFFNSHGYVYIQMDGFYLPLTYLVAGTPPRGFVKDHIDGDVLNNRKCNLRNATRSQNSQNVKKPNRKNVSSRFLGVSRWKNLWIAQTKFGKQYRKASFHSELDAAKWYDKMVLFIDPDAKTNGVLTPAEIAIAKTTPPKCLTTRHKDLPKFVTQRGKIFRVRIVDPDGAQFNKPFSIREEAERCATLKFQEFQAEKERRYASKEITRDSLGRPCILLNKRETSKQLQVLVDEKHWHAVDRWNWSWNGDQSSYPSGRVQDDRPIRLHRFIWELIHGPNIDGNVEHLNGKLDCRESSLRLLVVKQ